MPADAKASITELHRLIIEGDYEDKSVEVAQQALQAGATPMEIIEQGITNAMRVVGQKFEALEIFLPEMIRSAEVAQATLEVLKPHLEKSTSKAGDKKVILGTIQGDIHDIGKNIVRVVLIANGIDVVDLGKDVPLRNFLDTAEKENAKYMAISVIMSTSLSYAADLFELLNQGDKRKNFKIMVGGGCTSQEWADKVGSDGYGATAQDAVKHMNSWNAS